MSADPAGGRVPIRLDPIPGESFDSWLDAYGQRLLMSGQEVGLALGVPPRLLRLRGANVARGHRSQHPREPLDGAAAGSGDGDSLCDEPVISRQPEPQRPDPGGVQAARARGDLLGIQRRVVSSRWCPSCLRESGGRWLVAWRLPWYLACPAHQTLLTSDCVACGGTQRYAGLRAQHVPKLLTACSRPTAGRAGWFDHRCRHDLTTAMPAAPAPDGLIALQAEMVAILTPAVSECRAVELVDRLVDVLILATRIGLDLRAIDRDRRNMPSILAGPEAHGALSEPLGPRMRAIATNNPVRAPAALPQAWDGVSPALAAILLGHRDQQLGITERLRYRTMTGAGRRPEGTDPTTRLRSLPLALWPDWSIRLRPATITSDTFRIAAAIALCVPGSTQSIRSIRNHWPGPTNEQRMIKFGRLVTADPHGTAILAALCTLADHLDRHGAPIDYQRRRELAVEIELLDPTAWTVMCRAGGTPAGGSWKLTHARLWLWETLTGSLTRQAPRLLRLDSLEFLARHTRFALRLPAPTVRRLNEHARRLLDAHGCRHEPLTWSPSADDISLGRLLGLDPDAIDPIRVHAALARQQTPGQTAAELGITLEHLRYLARKPPPETEDRLARTAPRVRLATLLDPEQLRELINQGNSMARARGPLRHQPQDHPRRARRTRHPDPARPTAPPRDPARNLAVTSIPKTPAEARARRRVHLSQDQCPS